MGAEWEDVPGVGGKRPSSPEIFDMETEHDGHAASRQPPASIRLPPGLNVKPNVPVAQPFNMFAHQQVGAQCKGPHSGRHDIRIVSLMQ